MRRVPKRPGLYELRPGWYKLVVYAGKTPAGRSKQRSKTFQAASDRAAVKAANAVAAELDAQIAAKAERSATVNGLIDRWERDVAPLQSPSTVRGQAAIIARTRQAFGPVRLDELDAGHVDEWLADLRRQGLTPTTVANHLTFLRALLRRGKRWKMVASVDAAADATRPTRESYREGRPPTAAAVGVLWNTASPDLKVAVALAAWAGLRRGEVMGLRWSDIAANDVIHVRRARAVDRHGVEHEKPPKSGKARDVEIDPWLTGLLVEHRRDLEQRAASFGVTLPPDGPVLPDLIGHAMHDGSGRHRGCGGCVRFRGRPVGTVPRKLDWLTLAWSRHAKRQGAAGVRYHDLRHHFATEMIEGGSPLTAVQGQLGHLQLSTTMGSYAHVVDSTRRAAASVVAARRVVPTAELPAP